MAYRSLFFSFVSLCFIANGFTACGFGDDQKGQPIEPDVDAPPADAMPIDAMPMAKVFEVMPDLAIPDNDADGVSIPFTVTGVTTTTGLDIQVSVDHPYSGDIVIEFRRDNTSPPTVIKKLRDRAGGATDDILETYGLTPVELGTPINGSYSIHFSDRAPTDSGTISLVKLTFKVN